MYITENNHKLRNGIYKGGVMPGNPEIQLKETTKKKRPIKKTYPTSRRTNNQQHIWGKLAYVKKNKQNMAIPNKYMQKTYQNIQTCETQLYKT